MQEIYCRPNESRQPYLRQTLQLTGLGCDKFQDGMDNMQHLHRYYHVKCQKAPWNRSCSANSVDIFLWTWQPVTSHLARMIQMGFRWILTNPQTRQVC